MVPLTLLAMVILLFTFLAIYLWPDIGQILEISVEKWCVDIPFSAYHGRVTAANISAVTWLLDYPSWSGCGISEAG